MNFIERIKKFAKSQGLSLCQFQAELGYSNSYFRNVKRVSSGAAQKILAKYPDANIEWMNTGKGEMSVCTTPDVSFIPLLPTVTYGGSLIGFEDQVMEYDCEKIASPIKEAKMAIPVMGDSMSPDYPNGSIVFIKDINEEAFINWGCTFVLDTVNGCIIKNIYPCVEDDSKVICRSVNKNYPDFTVNKTDIRRWYKVLASLTRR